MNDASRKALTEEIDWKRLELARARDARASLVESLSRAESDIADLYREIKELKADLA